MAETLVGNATIVAQLNALMQNQVDGTVLVPQLTCGQSISPTTKITNGTGVNNANRFWQSTGRALASGASETLDLYSLAGINIGAGAGNDPFGLPLTLASVVGLLIHNAATSAGNLTIGGDGTGAAWTSPFSGSNAYTVGPIHPDGFLYLFDPSATAFPIVNTTNHKLKIAAAGGAVTYDIYLLARQ